MGRPPLRKKGAFTPAERQRRRRKRLAAERREAESAAKRAQRHEAILREAREAVWYGPSGDVVAPQPRAPATSQDVANELVTQLREVILSGDTTLEDILTALKL
jgi:hypothetical protein